MTSGDGLSRSQLRALRQEAAKQGTKMDRKVIDTIASLSEEHRLYVFRPETQCRVCMSKANKLVNTMLSHALTYREILRALDPINDVLAEDEKITYNSIRTHAERHFPIDEVASAVYRRMVEIRADEAEIDFVAGVGSALTPLAYMDVVMHKGFETLVDEQTRVSVETGMRAAETLAAITARQEENQGDLADAMLQLQRITDAVKTVVPPELWPRIIAHMEGEDLRPEIMDAEFEDEEVSGYDPGDPDFVDDGPEDD